jgi:hypothetical protein
MKTKHRPTRAEREITRTNLEALLRLLRVEPGSVEQRWLERHIASYRKAIKKSPYWYDDPPEAEYQSADKPTPEELEKFRAKYPGLADYLFRRALIQTRGRKK